jgi:hypothetical protein
VSDFGGGLAPDCFVDRGATIAVSDPVELFES